MNLKLLSLMKEAGFIFWEDEDWKPEDAVIDWATNYDKEIEKFAELLVYECCQKLENDGMVEVAMELKEHFGVE